MFYFHRVNKPYFVFSFFLSFVENENQEELINSDHIKTKLDDTQSALIAELKQRIMQLEKNKEPDLEISTVTVEPLQNEADHLHKKIVHTPDMETLTKENNKLNTELNIFREIVRKRESSSEKDVNDSLLSLSKDKIEKLTEERDLYKAENRKFRAELIRFASVSKDLDEVENKMNNNPDLNAYILQARALKQANEVLQRELQQLVSKENDLQCANENLWNELAKLKVQQVRETVVCVCKCFGFWWCCFGRNSS